MSGRNGASSGRSSSRGQPDPLQEVAGGAVQVAAGLGVAAGLLDQAAGLTSVRITPSTLTPRTADTRARLTGCL